jgi:uncharacterized protein
MSDTDPFPSPPEDSHLFGIIAVVKAVYESVEADQRAFLEAADRSGSRLACPPGCGSCCEPFVPDILPVEAVYAAAWLLREEPALAAQAATWERDSPAAPPCPFYRSATPEAHCAIYPARFLICRLFCAAGMYDREGRPSFKPCAHMSIAGYPPQGAARPVIVGENLTRLFGAQPPIMADYAAELVALSPSEAGDRLSVVEALPKALMRVGLSLSLAHAAFDRTYSSDEEPEPEPIAS